MSEKLLIPKFLISNELPKQNAEKRYHGKNALTSADCDVILIQLFPLRSPMSETYKLLQLFENLPTIGRDAQSPLLVQEILACERSLQATLLPLSIP